ncbi:MAG TPA: hypothetical protein VKB80_30020, partial [Kofleriaceae bacterium]|nr:hypothetical protein [Kofleriaceae bacterium]
LGTPAYMAPEQCKGTGEVDHRADLYSLGCILYAMVCGRPPFVSDGMGELMAKHIYEPVPPPGTLAPVSPALEHVIMRALAKDPDARYGSADELAAALEVAAPSGAHPAAASVAMSAQPGRALPTPASGSAMTTIDATPAGMTPSPAARSPSSSPSLPPSPARGRRGRRWLLVAGAGLAAVAAYVAVARPGSPDPPAIVLRPAVAAVADAATARAPAVAAASGGTTAGPTAGTTVSIVELDVVRAADRDADVTRAATPPAPVTLRITSIPPGADVYRMPGRERVGTTPVELTRPAGAGEILFLVERRGHRAETIAVPGDRDATRVVRLRARARAPRDETREQAPLPPGTTLNPFER